MGNSETLIQLFEGLCLPYALNIFRLVPISRFLKKEGNKYTLIIVMFFPIKRFGIEYTTENDGLVNPIAEKLAQLSTTKIFLSLGFQIGGYILAAITPLICRWAWCKAKRCCRKKAPIGMQHDDKIPLVAAPNC